MRMIGALQPYSSLLLVSLHTYGRPGRVVDRYRRRVVQQPTHYELCHASEEGCQRQVAARQQYAAPTWLVASAQDA